MLCSRPRPLNASATAAGLPNAQRERPSRAAGSFFGQIRSLGLPLALSEVGHGREVPGRIPRPARLLGVTAR